MTPLAIRKTCPPPVVSPRALTLEGLAGRWEVLSCYCRHEKQIAWKLLDAGFGYYLPMTRSEGKDAQRDLPEFPGIVFVCTEDVAELRWRFGRARESSVLTFIPVPNQSGLVRELSAIEHALRDRYVMKTPCGFPKGQSCEIIGGPFMGYEGLIDDDGHGYAVIEIEVLGAFRLLEIDPKYLRALDRPPLRGKSRQLAVN